MTTSTKGKIGKEGKTGKTGKTGKAGPVGPRWDEQDITKMDGKLDKLITAIYEGNGHKPLMERVAIVEEHLGLMLEASARRDDAIVVLTKTCAETTASTREANFAIKGHATKPHIFALISNLRFWGYLLLVFMVSHKLFDILDPLLTALIKAWTGITLP